MWGLIKWTIILAISGFVVYAGLQFADPHYKHKRFSSLADEIVKYNKDSEAQLREELVKKAADIGIKLDPESITIELATDGAFKAQVAWVNTVDIFGKYRKDYKFEYRTAP